MPISTARRRVMGVGAASTLADAVFYYEFETTSWLDSSSGGNALTGTNSPTSNTGKIGNAIYLASASSQYASHADATAFDMSTGLTGGFTITCWLYADTVSSFRRALWKGINTAAGREYGIFLNGSSQLTAILAGVPTSSAVTASWGSSMSSTTWTFVEFYWTIATDKISININNGTAVASASLGTGGALNHTANSFKIGTDDATGNFWDGRIDSVGGWKRLLTPTERAYLYNSGNGADPAF